MPGESDCKDRKLEKAERDGASEFVVRTRKRKADVVVFLQDPDEDIPSINTTDRKSNENQSNYAACPYSHLLIPTPEKDEELENANNFTTSRHHRVVLAKETPLPVLGWADRDELWQNMLNKEQKYARDKLYMEKHPLLEPKMRVILLDWLMEEIYPPKLHQFAYVTDGACTEDDIISMELIIMKALKWNLSPLTIVSWLNIYMQVAYLNEICEMLLPQYSQEIFVQVAELLDLCVLDVGCLEHTYGVLAASALYHFSSRELMQRVSGYELSDIEKCVKWMVPFAMAIKEVGSSVLKHFRGVPAEDLHNIQTHINTFDLLDKARAKQAMLAEKNRCSPLPAGVLTPPQSSKKLSRTSK
ncbi:G1/S-specific cyclin-E1 isoform X2 [Ahaetulla prasina]|uniref:G1/S-specific cyclin-E1 isoform X2 n=1 Tax=Ahaetulla prasina TaxID=499056 RepID=UPI002649B37F|nr:G1/S-specific cyclin-E1 isoform X2 [Ahaetulla prasina]